MFAKCLKSKPCMLSCCLSISEVFFLVLRPQEIKDVLRRCDAQKVWSDNAINVMAQEAHHHFTNGESIDFDKFRALPRKPNSSNAGFHQQEG